MQDITPVGLGTWKAPTNEILINAIVTAIEECGYRQLDCAACYENQQTIGEGIQKVLKNGKVKREELWITSKLWNENHDPAIVEETCRQTLKDLQIDYLDLYLMHWPCDFESVEGAGDATTETIKLGHRPLIETWNAMEKLVEKGLVRHIGVSNFTINMLERFRFSKDVHIQPYLNQVEFHLYMQQEPMRDYLHKRGIRMGGYSPLGSNDWRSPDTPNLLADPVLNQVAKELGVPAAQVALRFLQQLNPGVTLLVKSTSAAHLKSNIYLPFTINQDQMQRLIACERCYRYYDARTMWNCDPLGDGW